MRSTDIRPADRPAPAGAEAGPRRVRGAIAAAGLWSAAALAAGLYWAVGGAGFPFGDNDPMDGISILAGLSPTTGGALVAGAGAVGVAVAAGMAAPWTGHRRPAVRAALLWPAWVLAAILTVVVVDYRVLVHVTYSLVYLLGGFVFADGPPPWPWHVVAQVLSLAGGTVWAAAALAYRARTKRMVAGRMVAGRGDAPAGWTSPAAAARWGRWAVGVAIVVPILYAAVRWTWALGIPVGVDEEFFREGQESGLWRVGGVLGTLAVGGALLTLGLAQRWGEVFPRWVPWLAGRRVPVTLATVPAMLVAVLVTGAGLMFIRLTATGYFEGTVFDRAGLWATVGPELLWPLWGSALGAAALAYHLRRRGGQPVTTA